MNEINIEQIKKLQKKIMKVPHKRKTEPFNQKQSILQSLEDSYIKSSPVVKNSIILEARSRKQKTQSDIQRLYQDAIEKQILQEEIQKEQIKQSRIICESKKISTKSEMIIQDNLKYRITQVILKYDTNQSNQLTFQNVGQILTELNLFEAIQFDQQQQLKTNPKNSKKTMKDMIFHEMIFLFTQILSQTIDIQDNKHVNNSDLFTVLFLLQDSSISFKQRKKKLFQMLQKNNFEISERFKQKTSVFFSILKSKLLSFVNRNFQKNQELQKTQASFSPVINRRSVSLAKKRNQKYGKSCRQISPFLKDVIEQQLERFEQQEQIRNQKIEKQKMLKDLQEQKQLTFSPKTNKKNSKKKIYPSNKQYKQIIEKINLKNKLQKEYIKEQKQQIDAKEKKECTFKPKITKYNPNIYKKPKSCKSFDKTVGRLRYGWQKHQEYVHKLNHKPIGENYEYYKSLPPNPPLCAINYKVKKPEPFIVLDIKVRNGLFGKLALKKGDDPQIKARDFAIAFQLDQDQELGLQVLLSNYLDEHQSNFNQQLLFLNYINKFFIIKCNKQQEKQNILVLGIQTISQNFQRIFINISHMKNQNLLLKNLVLKRFNNQKLLLVRNITRHAGYYYSGQTAAFSYLLVKEFAHKAKTVFVLGPSHKIGFEGCALSDCSEIQTPFGNLKVDMDIINELKATQKFKKISQKQDENEHSLEMQYPFLKYALSQESKIVPIMVGSLPQNMDQEFQQILQKYYDKDDCLFVISTDFCHWGQNFDYRPFKEKKSDIYKYIEEMDKEVSKIKRGFKDYLNKTQNTICGRHPLMILNKLNEGSDYNIEELYYDQSNKVVDKNDMQVSYFSGLVYKQIN